MLSSALAVPAPVFAAAQERPPEAAIVADEEPEAEGGGLFQVRLKRGDKIKVVARFDDASSAKAAWRTWFVSPPADIQLFDVSLGIVRGAR